MNKYHASVFLIMALLLCAVTACSDKLADKKIYATNADIAAPRVTSCGDNGIIADCVVTYYDKDGSKYVSEQQHRICPVTESIFISAAEPAGLFVWQLSGGHFGMLKGAEKIDKLPATLCRRNVAQVVLDSIMAGAGFLGVQSGTKLERVKMEGRWYQPVELPSQQQSLARRILYLRDKDSIVDMVRVEDSESGAVFTSRIYNFRRISPLEVSVPAKIDVFSSNSTSSQRHILQINYHTLRTFDR